MTIVFVNPVGVIGGGERVLLTIMAALRTASPSQELHLILGTDGPLVESAQRLGVQVKVLKLPDQASQLGDSALKGNSRVTAVLMVLFQIATTLPAIAQYLVEFRRTIREIDPDLIHSNGIKTHLLTSLAGIKGIPIVWHIHDFYGSRPLIARVLRLMSDKAAIAIAISSAVAQDAKATLPNLPVEVIYNAVDVNYFSPALVNLEVGKSEDASNSSIQNPKSKIQNREIRVGLVATFARWKGHEVFLDAAAQIIRDHPDLNIRFYIVGGAIYKTKGSQFSEQELQERASVLEIEDKVIFMGFQQNIADVYRMLDIVVHASTQPEPFGLAIVEAMACGKPVIVSQAGGAAELFTDKYDAVGVEPGNAKSLALAIAFLIDNPTQRQLLSENARKSAVKRFSHDRLGQQILAVYRRFYAF